jgi:tryptophan synthase alpha chain
MTYYNIILQYWVKKFIYKAKTLWIYAIIVPDIPSDEQDGIELIQECKKNSIHFIYIVSPNILEYRLKEIWKHSTGFLYAISNNMTTGNTWKFEKEFVEYIDRLRQYIHIPIWVWFWVKTKYDLDKICNVAEFGIIGSELINVHASEWNHWLVKYLDNLVK